MYMKNTIARGSEAELMVYLVAVQQGFNISIPLNHHSEYDLIIDNGSNLYKIQVKRAFETNSHGYKRMLVETRRIISKHSGKGGCVAKTYSENGYDFLIAVDCIGKGFWIIPRSETRKHKAQIYLGKEKQIFFEQWNLLGDGANQSSETKM